MFDIKTWLSFEELIAIKVLKIVYWIGMGLGLVSAVIGIFGAIIGGKILYALIALVVTFLGLLLWRMWCEIWLVIFGIYDRLGEIRDQLRRP